jgi:hypothetical protein
MCACKTCYPEHRIGGQARAYTGDDMLVHWKLDRHQEPTVIDTVVFPAKFILFRVIFVVIFTMPHAVPVRRRAVVA